MFKDLGWQKIESRMRDKRLIMVYKALHGQTPSYITDMFTPLNEIHEYSLRSTSSRNVFLEGGNTEYHRKSFSYLAAKEWNQLPGNVKESATLPTFKHLIKSSTCA